MTDFLARSILMKALRDALTGKRLRQALQRAVPGLNVETLDEEQLVNLLLLHRKDPEAHETLKWLGQGWFLEPEVAQILFGADPGRKRPRQSGAGTSPGKDKPPPPPPKKPPPPKDQPRLVSVEWVEGAGTIDTGTQWVNLPRAAKWADGRRVTTQDRCSRRPWIKVKFDRPGSHNFRIRIVPGGSNPVYSGGEKGRNPKFLYAQREKAYTTDGDGTRIIEGDLFLTVAGKSSWKAKAKDDFGNEAQTGWLSTKRLAYYVELPMQGLTSVATSVSAMKSEFARHDLEFVSAGRRNMVHMPNISTTDTETFKNNARTAYQAARVKSKEPYLIAIAYTDHLAVKDAGVVVTTSTVTAGPGTSKYLIPISDASGNRKYLWKNIVPSEGWFVSAEFLPAGGGAPVAVPAARFEAVADSAAVPDMCSTIRADLSGLAAGTGRIRLTINWVNRMRGGISLGGGNIVCICTRAWWQNASTADQNQTMIHEIGHQLGMVPDGTGTNTDKTATQYTGKGHVGSHCHNGIAVMANYGNAAGSTCVMFGATNGINAFCANCRPGVRKNDFSAGWTAF